MPSEENVVSVSHEDWSLHRKGHEAQMRHEQKIKQVLKDRLPEMITEEAIVMSKGKEKIKIPIRSLEEYKIRYRQSDHVGQGNGESEVGDVVAQGKQKQKSGKGEAGDQAGEDFQEVEVSIAEMEELLFSELELPYLEKRQQDELLVDDIAFTDIRRHGLLGNIDKRQTIKAALKRNAQQGVTSIQPITKEDLRYKTWTTETRPESNAVVIAMMDTSGSMGSFEKYMARSFFFWMTRFLRTTYEHVEVVFIAHHTQAKEVDEEAFFTKGESGGTICSSAYELALSILKDRYPKSRYNSYPIHFSDGDNLHSDNPRCLNYIEELLGISNMFGYGEVNQYGRKTTLMNLYKDVNHERFRSELMKDRTDIYKTLKSFFSE
ncbi:sporulation protein YhbH [Paenalkalicoccus suaedae]|uniref:Sporulation protein YhbH n=1 Tax=Paenalkalicoccus suaedae TaxID=2592382 RepID=A0A859FC61_9BACI|nr:sporulation protein YhbH [Paenalkalicoccus suaedae]QKS70647.1 sporulation protein YhbH [Paenalkalicoccus suaedae]